MFEKRRSIQYVEKSDAKKIGSSDFHILGHGPRNTDVLLITHEDKVLTPKGYRTMAALVGGIIGVLSYLAFIQ